MTDAMLDAAAIEWVGDEIRIAFPPESDAVGRQMTRKESIDLLESVAAEAAGTRMRVVVSAGPRARTAPAPPGVRTETHGPAPSAPEPPDSPGPPDSSDPNRDQLLKGAKREPGISKLLKEFGANIVDIRPLAPPLVDAPQAAEAPEETE